MCMRASICEGERNNSSKALCGDCNYQSRTSYWTLCIMTFGTVIIVLATVDSNVKWHSNKKCAVLQLSPVKPIFHHQFEATDWEKIPPGKYILMLMSACACMWEHNAWHHPLRTRWSSAWRQRSPPWPTNTAHLRTHNSSSSSRTEPTVDSWKDNVLMRITTHSLADRINSYVWHTLRTDLLNNQKKVLKFLLKEILAPCTNKH